MSEREEHFLLQRAGFSQALSTAPRGSHLHTVASHTHIFTASLLLHLYSVQSKEDIAILPCEIMD